MNLPELIPFVAAVVTVAATAATLFAPTAERQRDDEDSDSF